MLMRKFSPIFSVIVFLFFILTLGLAGCSNRGEIPGHAEPQDGGAAMLVSEYTRNPDPAVSQEDLDSLINGNTDFALHLFQYLVQSNDNLFFSPYSVSVALAMTYAGSSGTTKTDMAAVLGFTLDDDTLHPAFNRLDLKIMNVQTAYGPDAQPFILKAANSLWLDEGLILQESYLQPVQENYGSALGIVDFGSDPDGAANEINGWIEEQTNDRIQDMLNPSLFDDFTAMVLVNAIYFMADWMHQFDEYGTRPEPFYLLDGTDTQADMMYQKEWFDYSEGENWQAVKMKYLGGDVSMVVLLPKNGEYTNVESMLDGDKIREILDSMSGTDVKIWFPKFEMENFMSLNEPLINMGMGNAFQGGFDKMIEGDDNELFISDVLHQAFIAVDENGTEAAAATAVIMERMMMEPGGSEPEEFRADRPFIYMIVEESTDTILFMGRMLDPS